ncbi:protein NETWORKED 4B-like [Cornus florida]|uniref:protein NETWORKED 4B-like n=1 Tax=Cornus florida TaxID=4283 RepID=UPI0028962C85|nr:protein NETWORKED 4B-like [Cornus florida]XP_059659885.1 protein NETWORKED 4B-like [Cornus florida]XP_059659886.1 protein NETWORKED 4B-like [Cornus florida]XP_059659887.1 protein NETWORKED 4B-like [Cornus florida]XP_059659888.1 protein NETWORKED 4B-like [Cornus florida]
MASSLAKTHKNMKRTDSKKSHSWWWDSHISPKNSKWLAENLEEMDQSVKRMLKLIEEDGDSFAKKAEMYYQKRPELISHVEEFYRIYRSLAERYDNVTGELRKNIPSDLQSQGSGISDIGSEPASALPSPDQRLSHRKSGPRAAGFEFFLGSGGSSAEFNKEGDESSTLDSESESDDSSVNNYSSISGNGDDQGLRRKIIELEVELHDVKEKLRVQKVENADGSSRGTKNGIYDELLAKIGGYDEELKVAKEKIRFSEEEIARLKIELQKYEALRLTNSLQAELDTSHKDIKTLGANVEVEKQAATELEDRIDGMEAEFSKPEGNNHTLEEELKMTKEKLRGTEKEVANLKHELESNGSTIRRLQDQLKLAQKDVAIWKVKLDKDKKEVSKLQDRIVRYKANLLDRDQEIRAMRETISNANQTLSDENSQLQAEISKFLKKQTYLEDNLKEWELRCQSLEEEIRRIKAGKAEMEGLLGAEIEQLKASIAERDEHVEELKLKCDLLMVEKDEFDAKILAHVAEVTSRDGQIDQMNKHLHQLHMEHVELIAGAEKARKLVEELRSRVEELEKEVEGQRVVILEGAEEKREAIRQLCFSIEHYRDGYHQLRQAFIGHKRLPIMAS